MNRTHAPHHRRTATLAALAGLCAAAAGGLGGCAQNRAVRMGQSDRTPTVTREQAETSALARLAAMAESQAKRPLTSLADAPPPPGLDPALAQPVAPADAGSHALTPLTDAISALAAKPLKGAVERDRSVDPEAADSALRLYISGREKLMGDDTAGAIKDLSAATSLDPTAGEPWRELGEAQLAAGSRAEAAASFRKAVDRGLSDPRVLELLGRWSLERGDTAAAAEMLSRAYQSFPERLDPFLRQVIDVALWRALAGEGYIVASRDVLRQAINRPVELSSTTHYTAEYSAILRRMGDLWREIGDADCRLGDFAAAADAYREAAQEPSLEGKSLLARLVFAQVRSGHPAAAAVDVLTQVMESGGQADPQSVELLRYLARTADLSGPIASALESYRRSVAPPPSLAGGLARAQAAIAPASEARDILGRQVLGHPSDLRSASDLFSLIKDPAAVASQAATLCETSPTNAGRIAEAILRSGVDVEPVMEALRRSPRGGAGTLVLAYTEAARGDVEPAADLLGDVRAAESLGPAVALTRVQVGALAGRPDLSRKGLAALQSGKGLPWSRAEARGLAWAQHAKSALAALEPTLDQPAATVDDRIDDLLLAGDLAAAQDRPDDAERWLNQAAALDPFDDRPAGKLLGMYSPGGARPDAAKVNQIVRNLRENMPESHALRAARIKELMRRSLPAQAEHDAMQLAEEDPSDNGLIDLVAAIWKARADNGDKESLARGKAWFEARLDRRPRSPVLLAGLSTILLAQNQAQQAADRLRDALASGGVPDISRLLEKVLRDNLNKADEADALALKRLEYGGRTIGETLELADIQTRHGQALQAATTISSGIPGDAVLTPDQGTKLLLITQQAAQRAMKDDDQAQLAVAAGLFDMAVARKVRFSPDMHQDRLKVLAKWKMADAERVLDAAKYAASEFPSGKGAAYVVASRLLSEAGRGPVALTVISRAVGAVPDPDVEMFTEWCRDLVDSATPDQAEALIKAADHAGKLKDLVERITGRKDAAPTSWPAELMYVLGNLYTAQGRPDQANEAYEITLRYDPDHAWACNNLGYALADKGVQIERASRLLEKAHQELPDQAEVTDSLGWLRYKQGVILDETDAAGGMKREGAVSLLRSASQTASGKSDPTILNHLGDALWLAGRSADAVHAWELAERLAARRLAGGGAEQAPSLGAGETGELRTLREAANAKRHAATSGGDVAVAPQLENPHPKPLPSPGAEEPGKEPRTGSAPNPDPATVH